MASVAFSGFLLELKKAPKNGMVGAARRALVLVFEWGGLRVEDKNREEQNLGTSRIGMVWCLRGKRILRDNWVRIEAVLIGK